MAEFEGSGAGASSSVSVTGNVTVVQPTGTNLHTVVDSGSVSVSSGSVTETNSAGIKTDLDTIKNAVTVDQTPISVGTSSGHLAMFVADETSTDSVSEQDQGYARMTTDRRQINASDYAEDSVFANASYLSLAGVEIDDPTALATMTEGDVGNLKGDLSGRLITTAGTLTAGEFLTEGTGGVLATVRQPLATSTFAGSKDASSALEASKIVKATTGNLKMTFGVIDKSAPTGLYYVLHLDSATLTGDGAVTHLITPVPVNHVTGTDSSFETPDFDYQVNAANGIVRVLSSTMVTKTITSAYMFATTLYK